MPGQIKKDDMSPRLAPDDVSADASVPAPATTAVVPLVASSLAVNDSRWWSAASALRGAFARMVASIRSLGPYVAIEVLLPGGSIIALALWVYRRRRKARDADAVAQVTAPAASAAPLRCLTPCPQR